MLKSIFDIKPQVEALRTKGVVRGEKTGFKCLDELYSVKQGTFTFIFSEPTHGKSELTFEICMNQAEQSKRCMICSPETGSIEEIVAELIHKRTGKRIYNGEYNLLSDREFHEAMNWLQEYFVIVDSDEKAFSVQQLFEMATEWEKQNTGKKIDIIVGEPYNELDHSEMSKFGGRQDLYIEDLCSFIRRACRTTKKHFILTIHPSGSAIPINKNGFLYYPKPLPRQAAGGQALYRKAMTWITLWRPTKGYKNDYGIEAKDNEVHVYIDKAKPKGVSFKGMCKLYFDWNKNRYYEEAWGNNYYAFEQPNSVPVQPELQPVVIPQETPTQHHELMLSAKQTDMFLTPEAYEGVDPF